MKSDGDLPYFVGFVNKSVGIPKGSFAETISDIQKKKEKALKFDSKLADCYSKDRSRCEIYITEGDSASGNLKTARNNEFQAVMPVRGRRRLLNLIEY